jgi:ABC-type nitrate/sulfonate/bicarbonate transport system substrate-binding protein
MSKYATVPAALCLLVGLMTPAAPQAPFKLRIASVNSPPSMHTLYMRIAHEEGIYKRNGLDVDDIISLTSGPLMTQALASGHVDVGDTDAEGVLNAVASGFGLAVVAAPSQHLSYVVMVQPDIKTLRDLAGQPFAISRPGAQSQYLLFPLLDQAGVARNAVTWIPIGGPGQRRLALVNNRVKGALLHLDYALAAKHDGKVVELDRVARGNPDYPHQMLVVRKELIEKRPDVVTAVTRSIIEACRFMVAERERTIDIYMKVSGETDRNLVNTGYDALLAIHGFGVNGGMTRKGLEIVTRFAVENGAKSIPIDSWSDFRFQEEALKQIGRVTE